MEISGNTAFYAGLSTITSGQNRVDQAAGQIANATVERSVNSQSSDTQVERLLSLDRAPRDEPANSMIELTKGRFEAEVGVKVAKAADEVLGTLIDTFA